MRPEPRALLLWPGPQRQLRPLRVSPLRALQEARQGRRAECVSVPGQRRRRSLRGTTKIRPGLFVLSVCARMSHRKLLGGMSRSRLPLRRPPTRSKMPPRSPSVLLVCVSALGPSQTVAFAPAGAGRAAAEDSSGERGGSGQNRKQMCSANVAAKARESTPAPGRI